MDELLRSRYRDEKARRESQQAERGVLSKEDRKALRLLRAQQKRKGRKQRLGLPDGDMPEVHAPSSQPDPATEPVMGSVRSVHVGESDIEEYFYSGGEAQQDAPGPPEQAVSPPPPQGPPIQLSPGVAAAPGQPPAESLPSLETPAPELPAAPGGDVVPDEELPFQVGIDEPEPIQPPPANLQEVDERFSAREAFDGAIGQPLVGDAGEPPEPIAAESRDAAGQEESSEQTSESFQQTLDRILELVQSQQDEVEALQEGQEAVQSAVESLGEQVAGLPAALEHIGAVGR